VHGMILDCLPFLRCWGWSRCESPRRKQCSLRFLAASALQNQSPGYEVGGCFARDPLSERLRIVGVKPEDRVLFMALPHRRWG
jgi:hypothetical protein